ncbi:MAG: hypothetical protein AAF378_07785 [Cyanobacteria bacterium P01_A01_bin.84]
MAYRKVTQHYQPRNLGFAIAYGRSLTIAYSSHPYVIAQPNLKYS